MLKLNQRISKKDFVRDSKTGIVEMKESSKPVNQKITEKVNEEKTEENNVSAIIDKKQKTDSESEDESIKENEENSNEDFKVKEKKVE